ncbi:MAG: maleate isomerase [Gammaproteobacteria bacterium]|jgi:maleate isomerase
MMKTNNFRRIGLIVPSSNVTMETEIPALLHARQLTYPDRFTFHSSRMRMKSVVKEELERMDDESGRCAIELSDAQVEVQAYACLVAIMCRGSSYHEVAEKRLFEATVTNHCPTPVLSSAGALIKGLHAMGAKKVSIICPYMKPLTKMVVDYIEEQGIEVKDYLALEIADNLQVASQDPMAPSHLWKRLDTKGVDAIVGSACVQMPSLPSIKLIEKASGIPTLSASIATVWEILKSLQLEPVAEGGGSLLSGRFLADPLVHDVNE